MPCFDCVKNEMTRNEFGVIMQSSRNLSDVSCLTLIFKCCPTSKTDSLPFGGTDSVPAVSAQNRTHPRLTVCPLDRRFVQEVCSDTYSPGWPSARCTSGHMRRLARMHLRTAFVSGNTTISQVHYINVANSGRTRPSSVVLLGLVDDNLADAAFMRTNRSLSRITSDCRTFQRLFIECYRSENSLIVFNNRMMRVTLTHQL